MMTFISAIAKRRWPNIGFSSLSSSAQCRLPILAQCDSAHRSNVRPTCWLNVWPTCNIAYTYVGPTWHQRLFVSNNTWPNGGPTAGAASK